MSRDFPVYWLYKEKVSKSEPWTHLAYDVMKWQGPLEEVRDASIGDETELHSLAPCEQKASLLHRGSRLQMWMVTSLMRHLRSSHAPPFTAFITMKKMFLIKPTQTFKKDLFVRDFIYKIQTNVREPLHRVVNPLDQASLC